MTSKTTTVLTCDVCTYEITKTERYINAGTYDIDMHTFCGLGLDFFKTVQLLGLDEIKVMRFDDWENADKLVSFKSKGLI